MSQDKARKASDARLRSEGSNDKSLFLSWYHKLLGGTWGTDPGKFDPQFVLDSLRRLRFLHGPGHYFRLQVEGWENLPPAPSVIVSNHSGGAAAPDAWGFLVSWHEHFQAMRPIHGMAHEMVLSVWITGYPFERLGVLRADPKMARQVLSEWKRDIFVMPGGDEDVFRPHKDRYKVQFAGRKGYVRLALRTGTPIVPVANAGAHDTLYVLTDGRQIAKALRLDKLFRLNVFPIHISFPWGLAIGPLPHLPPPAILRYKIGKPILPPAVSIPLHESPPLDLVEEYDHRVQVALQELLDQLAEEEHKYTLKARIQRKCRQIYHFIRNRVK